MVRAYLEADAPRVCCPQHGVVVAAVPWARHGAGHTRAFDDTAAWLAVHTSKQAVGELLRVAWATVGRIVTRVVADVEASRDRFAGLRRIGSDEVSYKKGHRYLTVVVDHDAGRLVWAAPGHDAATLGRFFDTLGEERCQQLQLISADAAPWIATVVAERCPQARLCLDPFHVARVGHRRAGPGPPPGVERRAQGRADRTGTRAQGRPLCAVEEPRRPDRPPARQARLDRPGQRSALPRLPPERRTQAGVHTQGRAGHRPARGVAGLGPALPHPRLRGAGQDDHPAPRRHPGRPHPWPVQRPGRAANTKIRLLTRVTFGCKSPQALIALAMLSLGGLCPPLPGRG